MQFQGNEVPNDGAAAADVDAVARFGEVTEGEQGGGLPRAARADEGGEFTGGYGYRRDLGDDPR